MERNITGDGGKVPVFVLAYVIFSAFVSAPPVIANHILTANHIV